jgi:uncharacterized repeat protein (TIGR01451 family)
MLVASAASADVRAPLTVTYEKVLCSRYADVPANSEPSNIDDTGGFWQELNTSYGSRYTGWTTDPAYDLPAACTKAAGWQFEFMNGQGGDVIGTYTTESDGTVSVALPDAMGPNGDDPIALARGSGLWLREITQPAKAGFGSLRCYNDILNGDNLENIAGVPASVTHIYCIAYNVAGPGITLTKTASASSYDHIGQHITYTYTVINTSNVNIAQSQFQVTDNQMGTPKGTSFNCDVPRALTPNIATPSAPEPPTSGTLANPSPGSFVTCTAVYTVTLADMNNGSLTNVATASGAGLTTLPARVTIAGPATNASLLLAKDTNPSNYKYGVVGDKIPYTFTITNNGNVTLTGPFSVTDPLADVGSIACTQPGSNTLAPNGTMTCTATHTVVQADINNGSLTNTATATNGTVTSPPATKKVDGPAASAKITIVKTAAETSYSKVGDTLTYTYKVINAGNVTLDGQFTVSDDQIGSSKGTPFDCGTPNTLYSNSATLEDPSKGSFLTCTATYTIAQADLDRGHVTNVATATVVANDRTITSDPATVTVQAAQGPALGIVKTADRTTFTKAGETITYTYVLTNTGNVALGEPFTVSDDKINGGTAFTCGAATSLAVGASVTCTATYTVTLADLDAGKVVNTAIGHGRLGEATIDTASQLVTVTLQSLESVRAETATPTHAVTPPPTTTGGGPSGDSPTPFPALMICLAFGGLGLLAVQRQRRTLRR